MLTSTSTNDSGRGWQSGISSAVRLAAWIPAIRAVADTSPLGSSPRSTAAAVAGAIRHDRRGGGAAVARLLVAHVDHPRAPGVVEVGQLAHRGAILRRRPGDHRSPAIARSKPTQITFMAVITICSRVTSG